MNVSTFKRIVLLIMIIGINQNWKTTTNIFSVSLDVIRGIITITEYNIFKHSKHKHNQTYTQACTCNQNTCYSDCWSRTPGSADRQTDGRSLRRRFPCVICITQLVKFVSVVIFGTSVSHHI